jgi:hypothetical protein
MSGLDINTERGRETLWEEIEAIQILRSHWPDVAYIHTDKEGSAAVDAIIVRHERMFAVAETKCRQMTLTELRARHGNEWLVTNEKIRKGAVCADLLGVEFWGLLYLVPDKTLLRIKMYSKGRWHTPIRVAKTETQKTVNGGKIVRENAFIYMATADILVRR